MREVTSDQEESRGESRQGRGKAKCRRERGKSKESLHMLTQPSTLAPLIYSRTEDRERLVKTETEFPKSERGGMLKKDGWSVD